MAKSTSLRIVAGLSLVAAPVVAFVMVSDSTVSWFAVLGGLAVMAVGSFVVPAVSSGNRLTLSASAAAALPFVFVDDTGVDLSAVLGTYLFAYVVLTGVSAVWTKDWFRAVGYAARRFASYTAFALVFAYTRDFVGSALGDSGWEILVPFLAGGVVWFTVEVGLWSVFAANYHSVSSRYLTRAGLKDGNVFVSLVATGGLFGLMFESLGWWALPVALLPYSFAHGAFGRFQETRATYKQTIRALAQIPEAADLNLPGHADRTSLLSVAIAKDLGLTPVEVDDVDIAALMHDIGRITLNEPTVVEKGWTDEDLARWGAEIIAGAPSLDRVAGYVRRQYDPYRKPGDESDPNVGTIARIIKVASAYDARTAGLGLSRLQALEELHQGAAYEYDPEVVASLRRILDGAEQSLAANA